MKTQLILREDIPTLGFVGDVIEVSSGYARNYLVPCGKAFTFSEDGMRRVEKARAEAEQKRIELNKEFEAVADLLNALELTFEEKVSGEGHLYGAVTAKRIADALIKKKFDVTEQNVRLAEPIRTTGEYPVPVHVHGDVNAEIKVWVVAIQAETEA
ncbi:MAG: 50S ribosomal protein L9 [Planctomycetes bacterium]|nr:50S ribosomal protein L9 [Planctomycetota bacterium]